MYVKDPFGNGVAGVELKCEIHYRIKFHEYGDWEDMVIYITGSTITDGHAAFMLWVTAYYDELPDTNVIIGGPLSTDDLAQKGIYINIVGDPANPESTIGWPKYEFDCQDVWITNVPSGYTIFNTPQTYTIHSIAGVNYWAFNESDDQNSNGMPDVLENQVAEKFSPVLHSHSDELQANLSDPIYLLNNPSTKLLVIKYQSGTIFNSHVNSIHHWNMDYWCTYGLGYSQGIEFRVDIPDNIWHDGAPIGSRPLFYHCYGSDGSLYIQYWYFFNCNDIRNNMNQDVYHEGDLEHVSIKLNYGSSGCFPIAINFYQHEGGHTKLPNECYWSTDNSLNWNFQNGYNEYHTHLHIWISRNSHASYNLADFVYKLEVPTDSYTDNCDFNISSPNLYFEYDYLSKLGRIYSEDWPTVHGYTYLFHYFVEDGQDWIAFRGKFGADWYHIPGYQSTSPFSPAFGSSHEWDSFSFDSSLEGFGNENTTLGTISWVLDSPNGD